MSGLNKKEKKPRRNPINKTAGYISIVPPPAGQTLLLQSMPKYHKPPVGGATSPYMVSLLLQWAGPFIRLVQRVSITSGR